MGISLWGESATQPMRAADSPPTMASRKRHDQGVREHRIDKRAVAQNDKRHASGETARILPSASKAAEVEGRRGTEHSTGSCRDVVPTQGSVHVFIDGVAFAPTTGKQMTPLGNLVSSHPANEILKINSKCRKTNSGKRRIV